MHQEGCVRRGALRIQYLLFILFLGKPRLVACTQPTLHVRGIVSSCCLDWPADEYCAMHWDTVTLGECQWGFSNGHELLWVFFIRTRGALGASRPVQRDEH